MKRLLLTISIIALLNVIVFSQEIESGRSNDAKPSSVVNVATTIIESNKLESIQNGVVTDQDVTGNEIPNSDGIQNDQVINDDLIVTGSIGCGFDMVNNYSFGFNTFVMSENNLRIYFDDTSVTSGFPSNDWILEANESSSGGTNHFSINDVTGSKVPFKIIAGAPTNSFYLNSSGNLGFGTSTPVLKMHLVKGDTPGMRFDQDASSGWTPQVWDLSGNETNFFVRDVTSGSTLPFRIQPGSPTNTLTLKSDGNVGLGTWSPDEKLHVIGNVQIDSVLMFQPQNSTGIATREGVVYMDISDHTLKYYNGTRWFSIKNEQPYLSGNMLRYNDSDSFVDLSAFMDNTDNQTLNFAGNTLSIEGGNSIDLSEYKDNTDNQELNLVDNILRITGSNSSVNLSQYVKEPNTDDQKLNFSGNSISIESGNTIDLSKFLDNTDNQAISLSENKLSIQNGNTVDLANYLDNTDNQKMKLKNDTLRISGSDSIVVLSKYLDNTDDQLLSLAGNNLSIEGGNSVDLSNYLDNTDKQGIKLTKNILSITGSDSIVNLSGYLDNTDEQTLQLKGSKLSISNGNEIDLSALLIEKQKQIDELSTQIGVLNQAIIELKQMVTALGVNSLGDNTLKNSTIGQNIPNPFSMSTVIPYNISDDVKNAVIVFYSQKGQLVKQIRISDRGEGTYTFVPDNNDKISLYSLYVDGYKVDTKKMIMAE